MLDYTSREKGVFSRIISRLIVCLLVLSIVLGIPAFMAFRAEAEVALFHSDTYREEGVEITDETGEERRVQYEHFWGDFSGDIPEEATVVNNVTLHVSWKSVVRTVVTESPTNPEVDISTDATDEDMLHGDVLVPDDHNEEVMTEEEQPGSPIIVPTEHPEEDVQDSNESETYEVSPEPIIEVATEEADPVTEVEIHEEDPVGEVMEEVMEEEGPSSSDTEGFEEVSYEQLFLLANAEVVEPVAEENIFTPASSTEMMPEVIITESISTTSGFVSSDVIVEPLDDKFFEILYTIDGSTWTILGSVGFDESHEVAFDLSSIGLEGLRNLQIIARYTIPEGDLTKIVFDSLYVAVDHGEVLPPEIIETPVISDREPNFEVSSIRADVYSENIRAVLLERGGIYEFWYSLFEQGSDEVVWNRIMGGGGVDPSAPIKIKERTIFWLDRNQQTLFGFSVDEQSIFGVSFQESQEKTFLLPFIDEREKWWEASYDPVLNSLEFQTI